MTQIWIECTCKWVISIHNWIRHHWCWHHLTLSKMVCHNLTRVNQLVEVHLSGCFLILSELLSLKIVHFLQLSEDFLLVSHLLLSHGHSRVFHLSVELFSFDIISIFFLWLQKSEGICLLLFFFLQCFESWGSVLLLLVNPFKYWVFSLSFFLLSDLLECFTLFLFFVILMADMRKLVIFWLILVRVFRWCLLKSIFLLLVCSNYFWSRDINEGNIVAIVYLIVGAEHPLWLFLSPSGLFLGNLFFLIRVLGIWLIFELIIDLRIKEASSCLRRIGHYDKIILPNFLRLDLWWCWNLNLLRLLFLEVLYFKICFFLARIWLHNPSVHLHEDLQTRNLSIEISIAISEPLVESQGILQIEVTINIDLVIIFI